MFSSWVTTANLQTSCPVPAGSLHPLLSSSSYLLLDRPPLLQILLQLLSPHVLRHVLDATRVSSRPQASSQALRCCSILVKNISFHTFLGPLYSSFTLFIAYIFLFITGPSLTASLRNRSVFMMFLGGDVRSFSYKKWRRGAVQVCCPADRYDVAELFYHHGNLCKHPSDTRGVPGEASGAVPPILLISALRTSRI